MLGAQIMGVIVDNMGTVDITGTVDIMGMVDTTGSGPGEKRLRPPPGLVVDITGSGPREKFVIGHLNQVHWVINFQLVAARTIFGTVFITTSGSIRFQNLSGR